MIAKNILANTEIVNSFMKSFMLVISGSDSSWDVFICYDSRDREAIARPLYDALTSKNLKVWYYEESMMGEITSLCLAHTLISRTPFLLISRAFPTYRRLMTIFAES
jgi:hypothetical protein